MKQKRKKIIIKRLILAQSNLSKKVIIKYNPLVNKSRYICAFDISYKSSMAFVVAVMWDILKNSPIEICICCDKVEFPYIPTFLAFREVKPIIVAYKHLTISPDILLIDAHGILHPRKIGCASHIGVILNKPSIGVAKKGLVGKLIDTGKGYANVVFNGETLGRALFENGKPYLYISPGHLIDLEQSYELVLKLIRKHKYPEPLYIADRLTKKVRKIVNK